MMIEGGLKLFAFFTCADFLQREGDNSINHYLQNIEDPASEINT